MKIPLASSGLRPKDIGEAIRVFESGNLTMGSNVREFENKMAEYVGSKFFIMTNSGSSANLAIFEALLRPAKGDPKLISGDGVLVPAIAWPTTIWPIIQLGLKPIFVDIDPITLGIDIKKAEEAITRSKIPVKAIFPIHTLGRSLDEASINNLCEKFKIIYISDVCESLGSFLNEKHAGASGLASSFSFYFSHHITTMEGGGIATNNADFADDLRSIRSHGWSRDRIDSSEWTKQTSINDSKFLFITSGYNIRPMEIQAAIGVSQIGDINIFLKRRREIAKYINEKLNNTKFQLIGSDTFINKSEYESNSWMLLPIQAISGLESQMDKRNLLSYFEENEIETRPVLTGNFLDQPAMKRIYSPSPSPRDFPIADLITNTTLLIGAHHDLSDSQIEYIGEKIAEISK